MCVAMC
jgi:endonuclease VIII